MLWGLIKFPHCLNAGKVNMQQPQRCGNIEALLQIPSCWMHCSHPLIALCIWVAMPGHQNWSFSKLSVCCWPWCPGLQWHPFMALLSETWGPWIWNFFLFGSRGVATVKGSLVECQLLLLLENSLTLFSICIASQQVFEILHSLASDPLNHGLERWILLLGGHIQVYACSSSLYCSFLEWLVYFFISLGHSWVISIWSFCSSHGHPIQDWPHSFCIQFWGDLAQGIYSCIVTSLLVFNTKCESCKWLYPLVSGGV